MKSSRVTRSLKTVAHALFLATEGRTVVTGKAGYTLVLAVSDTGNKVFTLRCGDAPVVTVDSAQHGGDRSVRSIADQLVGKLAADSGASIDAIRVEGGKKKQGYETVKLDLAALARPIEVKAKK